MFIQVIEGRVADEQALQAQMDVWLRDLAPGATGWLGTTAGTAADGTFVATARFESEEAAKANSDRPEQGAWWEATSTHFAGDVTFTNCPVVDTFGKGGSDDAGFVQFMYGTADRDALQAVGTELDETLRRIRPDVIGGTIGWPGDGSFIQVVYFTSEADARQNEQRQPSAEDQEAMGRLMSLIDVQRYVDLPNPWLVSA